MQEVAQRLKSLRESVGVSQAKLAALMGATAELDLGGKEGS